MTPQQRAELATCKAQLAAAFLARRCACGAPAMLVITGDDAVVEVGITLKAGRPDRNLCAVHAGLLNNARAA